MPRTGSAAWKNIHSPCPRIIQRNLKILLTQLKSKIKKKPKFGEFSEFPFPSTSRFPYRDRPVAGSTAQARRAGRAAGRSRGAPPPRTQIKNSPQKAPLKAAPVPGKPSRVGEQPTPGPSPGELLDPWGGSVAGLKGPTAATAPCLAGPPSRSPVLSVPPKTRHPAARAQPQLPWWVPSCPACGRVRRRLQRFPYIQGCPGPAAGKRAERGILLPGSLLRAGCFALLKVPGLGKCFPFHSWPERLLPRR
ncbi:PREDICTED: homeobox protein Hox-D4 isoform X2 [Ficedula albicollis]|uniref:homeobox protein Hox-D4 isoform X2 n=1 Tax=Ficedula albicollis TaxID=59894 RepID=UPI0007AD8875|nr:PREDICTED: homeobox protein Hox-D4 isoform X2 [Ficedula albicollis]